MLTTIRLEKIRALSAMPALFVLAGLAACITVNIYFPAPEVRAAAEQIVEETWGGEPAGTAPAVEPTSSTHPWSRALARIVGPRSAHAQDAPNVNVSTAAIRAIKEAMTARSAELKPFLAAGNVGIGADGMLVLRAPEGLAMRDRATVSRLVDAENADRANLYKAIAAANDYGEERVADIRAIFAETWVEKAEPGWWVQKPNDPGSGWRQVGAR